MKTQIPVSQYKTSKKDREDLLLEVMQHYKWWTDDNEKRKTRVNGWDDITRAYYGKLPEDWPFTSTTTDPRIRTALLEKNARLTNRNMRGKVVNRDDQGDVLKARINNALIAFQWDNANHGGSMNSKIGTSDIDTRMYGSKFSLVPWKIDVEGDKTIFEGNELIPLSIMDCGMDPNSEHIRNAKWFQHRSFESLEDIEANKKLYFGYTELMRMIKSGKNPIQNRRDTKYNSVTKQLHNIEDRMGTDMAFPVIEKVVEYRRDKWVIFCPQYNLLLGIWDNPYDHRKIPVSQLRYYQTDGDNIGESEVESVLPLWKAIQAVLCAFLDEVVLKMRPPLKVVEGAVRTETIVYYPDALWLMDNINAVSEVESRGDSIRFFQNIYPVLVSAFNVAMGELSQGVSNIDPLSNDKTATEVRQVARQQNLRDQKNQQELGNFIKDIVMMWISNNRQFLFKDETKHEYLLKIVGEQNFSYFKRLGLDEMVVTPEGAQMIQEIMQGNPEISQDEINKMIEAVKIPKHPVITNPEEKNPEKLNIKPKMSVSELGDEAQLSVEPDDLDGLFDFIPDMQSMEAGASEQLAFARTNAIAQITNPNILQLLQLEGQKPKIKDLLIADFEEKGLKDAERFFEPASPNFSPTGGVLPGGPDAGMGNVPKAPSQSSIEQQMA